MRSVFFKRSVAISAAIALGSCTSIGHGVHRLPMEEGPVGGRPLSYSDADIFACIDRNGRGEVYRVPYLYVTDQSSLPDPVVAIFAVLRSFGGGFNPSFSKAAIVHDYLYAAGVPGDVAAQKAADDIFMRLQRSEGVDGASITIMEAAFVGVRQLPGNTNPFGRRSEWRWADPETGRFATVRPNKANAKTRILNLASCATFDARKTDKSKRLHACLHYRYMSTNDLDFWPLRIQFEEKPAIPRLLRAYSRPDDVRAYMAGDCRNYS